jgi:hypothetical protein
LTMTHKSTMPKITAIAIEKWLSASDMSRFSKGWYRLGYGKSQVFRIFKEGSDYVD